MLSLLFALATCSAYVSLVVRVFAIVVLWFKLFDCCSFRAFFLCLKTSS